MIVGGKVLLWPLSLIPRAVLFHKTSCNDWNVLYLCCQVWKPLACEFPPISPHLLPGQVLGAQLPVFLKLVRESVGLEGLPSRIKNCISSSWVHSSTSSGLGLLVHLPENKLQSSDGSRKRWLIGGSTALCVCSNKNLFTKTSSRPDLWSLVCWYLSTAF